MIGSIGMPELIVILVIALLVVGPKKLPENPVSSDPHCADNCES